ncbi:MAG: hypothetical protein V5A48_00820 [Salinivenus sp.]
MTNDEPEKTIHAVQMVRAIQDQYYDQTKDMPREECVAFHREKARSLHGSLQGENPESFNCFTMIFAADKSGPVKWVVAVLSILVLTPALSQEATAQRDDAIYFELAGNGGVFSVNYDRAIVGGVRGRFGFSYFPGFITAPQALWFPATLNYVVGNGTHHLEVGAGPIVRYLVEQDCCTDRGLAESFYTATVAYRYENAGGFLFRIGLTPLYTFPLGNKDRAHWTPSGGISVGYAF